MRTVVTIIILAVIAAIAYHFIKEALLVRKAQRENAMNIVDIIEIAPDVVDESIPTASTPAFDPLREIADSDDRSVRPAGGIRPARDFIDNPVDDFPRGDDRNPYVA